MEKITVVKIGGNVIDDPAALRGFLADFASLPGAKILVHGGGKLATRLAQKLELQVQMVDGRRITDKGTLDIVTMVYAGLVNKQLVAGLQAAGCNALGLSGADGNAVMTFPYAVSATLSGGLLILRDDADVWAFENGTTGGIRVYDLATGAELPVPETALDCLVVDEGGQRLVFNCYDLPEVTINIIRDEA